MPEVIQVTYEIQMDFLILGLFITLGTLFSNLTFEAKRMRTRVEALERRLLLSDAASPASASDSMVSTLPDTPIE